MPNVAGPIHLFVFHWVRGAGATIVIDPHRGHRGPDGQLISGGYYINRGRECRALAVEALPSVRGSPENKRSDACIVRMIAGRYISEPDADEKHELVPSGGSTFTGAPPVLGRWECIRLVSTHGGVVITVFLPSPFSGSAARTFQRQALGGLERLPPTREISRARTQLLEGLPSVGRDKQAHCLDNLLVK